MAREGDCLPGRQGTRLLYIVLSAPHRGQNRLINPVSSRVTFKSHSIFWDVELPRRVKCSVAAWVGLHCELGMAGKECGGREASAGAGTRPGLRWASLILLGFMQLVCG